MAAAAVEATPARVSRVVDIRIELCHHSPGWRHSQRSTGKQAQKMIRSPKSRGSAASGSNARKERDLLALAGMDRTDDVVPWSWFHG